MEEVKDKVGERYRLQTLVHRKYVNQEWRRHCALDKSLKDGVVDIKR
jgi:hypothetical protein